MVFSRKTTILKNKKKALMLCCLLFVVSFVLSYDGAYAVTSSITVSIADSIGVELFPTTGGEFVSSSTETNIISVSTNHNSGYTLGVAASVANSNALINSTDSTKTIPSIDSTSFPSGISEADYSDDSFASSNNLNNTWAYRPSKINSVANNKYLAVPTSTTATIIDKTTAANSVANNYNVAIGARVNKNMASGHYSNTLVFTVIANPSMYSITYNKVTSDTVSNMPSNVTGATTSSSTVTLSSNVPTRTGYDFAGWCTVSVEDNAACSGTSYSAGGSWEINQTSTTNSLVLYARWVEKTYSFTVNFGTGVSSVKLFSVSNYGSYEQEEITTSGGSVTGLKAGVQYYLIPVFSDGYTLSSWTKNSTAGTLSSSSAMYPMFTIGAGNAVVTLVGKTCTNTTFSGYMQDVTSTAANNACPGSSGTLTDRRNSISYKVQKLGNILWMTQNLRISGSVSATYSNFSGSNFNPCAGYLTSGDSYTQARCQNSGFTETGYFYNYAAASAGTVTGDTNFVHATSDICPSNWKLPMQLTYEADSGFLDYWFENSLYSWMYDDYNNRTIGDYNGGVLENEKWACGFWASTNVDSNVGKYRYMIFGNSNSSRMSYAERTRGYYIRCVHQQ